MGQKRYGAARTKKSNTIRCGKAKKYSKDEARQAANRLKKSHGTFVPYQCTSGCKLGGSGEVAWHVRQLR
ncbi:hypothetical protein HY004_00070 [Candidatus Saccharibacteria bacterium]|nr:hypothetical protein [Candidatus Saccharibacteria bacterium]